MIDTEDHPRLNTVAVLRLGDRLHQTATYLEQIAGRLECLGKVATIQQREFQATTLRIDTNSLRSAAAMLRADGDAVKDLV